MRKSPQEPNQENAASSEDSASNRRPDKARTPDINRAIKQMLMELPSVEKPQEMGIGVAELARLMDVAYPIAHRWVHGGDDGKEGGYGPSIDIITKMEDRLGVIRGEVYRRSKRSMHMMAVADILRADESLLPEERENIVKLYLLAKQRSAVWRAEAESEALTDASVSDAS